ncbi:MAG TPA: FkbM family methyltransferase [Candidatus Paceibacterota bacterium]|nr:FkbM family methyltransferase [Candidatus Paceibacterota bacterium]
MNKILDNFKRKFLQFHHAKKFSSLGANWQANTVLFFFYLYSRLALRFELTYLPQTKIKLRQFGKEFEFIFTHPTDIPVFNHIFFEGEYEISDLKKEPLIILDLGSSVGISVLYFHLKYPKAVIHAFEADPNTFRILKENTKNIENIKVNNICLSDRDGEKELFISDTSVSSSVVLRSKNQQSVLMTAKGLDSIIKEVVSTQVIDLIKFDIEGAEFEVLSASKEKSQVAYMVGELHLDLIEGSLENFLAQFSDFKVSLKKNSSQRYAVYMKNKNLI